MKPDAPCDVLASMRKSLLLAAALSTLAATNASAGWLGSDCDFTAARSVRASASGITHVTVIARAGTLKIEGRNGAAEINASGEACASNKSLLDEVKLTSSRSGSELRLEVVIPENLLMQNAALDLTVILPHGLATTVQDGSGEATIAGTGTLDVTDGSGSLAIRDVIGNLSVEDGSGDLDVADVTGKVRVTDGSGSIAIRQIGGSVEIPADGSGGLAITAVKQNVHIVSKGSGSVDIADVGGNLTVDRGNRRVSYARVAGRVSVAGR